jgi:uncharacterized protein with GYD domain
MAAGVASMSNERAEDRVVQYVAVSSAGEEGESVAKYLIKASYSSDGIKGVLKAGGSARVAAVEEVIKSLGGSVEVFYFAFGTSDAYVIVELPDNASAAAVAAAVGASGALSNYETVVLLEPAEIDEAMKKSVNYRPPGG